MAAMMMMAGSFAACVGGGETEVQGSGLLAPPPEGEGVQLGLHAPVERLEEVRLCQLVALPVSGLDVTAIEHRLSAGAVEMTVSHTELDASSAPLGRVDCSSLETEAGDVAFSSTAREGLAELPAGTALHFGPAEVVLLQARFAAPEGAAPEADAVGLNLWVSPEQPALRTSVL